MKKFQMNYFEILCKNCEETQENPIVTVRKLLKKNIKSKDDLLRYKAEAVGGDFIKIMSFGLALTSMSISTISIMIKLTGIGEDGSIGKVVSIIIALSIMMFVLMLRTIYREFKCTSSWQAYVLVVIEELEKEIENGTFFNEEINNSLEKEDKK